VRASWPLHPWTRWVALAAVVAVAAWLAARAYRKAGARSAIVGVETVVTSGERKPWHAIFRLLERDERFSRSSSPS